MGLTQAKKLNRKGEPFEVKGGFITVVDNRVWKGVVRREKDDTILWICDHVHSRPEYNARHPVDNRYIWEYSALNCGREAKEQWEQNKTASGGTQPHGAIGEIDLADGGVLHRADTKTVQVGSLRFDGHVYLSSDGIRHLKVYDKGTYFGTLYPDDLANNSNWPDVDSRELAHWLTASGTLLDHLWGLTFRNPNEDITVDGPDYDIIRRLTPTRRSQVKGGNPHVRPKRVQGARLYEVVDGKGKVVATLPHRGKALKELEKLEAKG